MAEREGEDERDETALDAGEVGGPAALPRALRQDWPVPWQPVWGDKRGSWRTALSRATQALLWTATRLPEPLVDPLCAAAARALDVLLPERRRVAERFLETALGPLPPRERRARARGAWRHLLRVAIDAERFLARVPEAEIRSRFEIEWSPEAERLRDSGRGCVLVTAHVGNWEVAPAVAPWVGFDPFYAVAKPIRNRPFSKVVQRNRERLGIRLLPRRGAMKDAQRVLAAGGSIGMLLDQRARKKPVLAPFFGRLARCDRSAGVLMRRLGAPVLLVACYRTERPLHFRARFFDCLEPAELAGASPEAIATRINQAFEAMVRAAPDQYLWLHDRYKDTPEPADAARHSTAGPAVVE